MSNSLTTSRGNLAALLTDAGLRVVTYLPERPQPPMVIVGPGSPYLKRGDRFGHHEVRLDVLMLVATATNEVATSALDEMIATVAVEVFNSQEFNLGTVDPPSQFMVGSVGYLGAVATVSVTDVVEVS